jgi:membrane protease YdiL (CAAX protease family)
MKFKNLRFFIKIRGLLLFIGSIIIPAVFSFLIMQLINCAGNKFKIQSLKDASSNDLIFLSVSFIIFICLLLLIKFRFKKILNFIGNENWFITMGKSFIPAIIAFGLGLFAAYFIIFIFELIPQLEFLKKWIYTPNYGFPLIFDNLKKDKHAAVIFLFIYIIVLAPIYEEIIFRGFLQESMGKFFRNGNFDIIIVACIFSIFHINSLSNAIFAFTVGIIMSKVRKETRLINSTIWIHSIINFTGLFSGLLYYYLKERI